MLYNKYCDYFGEQPNLWHLERALFNSPHASKGYVLSKNSLPECFNYVENAIMESEKADIEQFVKNVIGLKYRFRIIRR